MRLGPRRCGLLFLPYVKRATSFTSDRRQHHDVIRGGQKDQLAQGNGRSSSERAAGFLLQSGFLTGGRTAFSRLSCGTGLDEELVVVASHVMRLQLLLRLSSRCSTSGVSGAQAGVGNGSGQLVHSAEGSGCGACRGGTDFRSAAFLRGSFRHKHVQAFRSNDLISCCGSEARRETNRSTAQISITAVPKFLREELLQYPIRRAPALRGQLCLQIEGCVDS